MNRAVSVERQWGCSLSSNAPVIVPSSEEPETTPFVKEQQSRTALPLLVPSGHVQRRRWLPLADGKRRSFLCWAPCVAALPERTRPVLALKVAGFSYDEIAAALGVSWLTVDRQLVRSRAAIRDARDGDRSARVRMSPGRVG